jgi:hypothetical protein
VSLTAPTTVLDFFNASRMNIRVSSWIGTGS